jgi:hypothetical protein
VPSVACVSEPLGAVILNAPAEGSAEEAEKGSLRAVVFPDDLADLDAAFGDGGFAARVVSGFDKDQFVLANASGYERVEVDDDGIALRGIVTEALRLGVASLTSLAEVDVASAAAFPAAWTSSPGLGPGTHRLRSRHRTDRAVLGAFDSRVHTPRGRGGVPICHVRVRDHGRRRRAIRQRLRRAGLRSARAQPRRVAVHAVPAVGVPPHLAVGLGRDARRGHRGLVGETERERVVSGRGV